MAFSRPVACVDGNIRRVMARQTNQEEPSMKDVQTFADNHLFEDSPGTWNQAMMELGALVCRPRNPFVRTMSRHGVMQREISST